MCPKFAIHAEPRHWNKGCLGLGLLQVWTTLLKEELWKIFLGGMSSFSKWKTQKIHPSQTLVSRGICSMDVEDITVTSQAPQHTTKHVLSLGSNPTNCRDAGSGCWGHPSHYWGAAGEPLGQHIRPHHLSRPAFPHTRAGKERRGNEPTTGNSIRACFANAVAMIREGFPTRRSKRAVPLPLSMSVCPHRFIIRLLAPQESRSRAALLSEIRARSPHNLGSGVPLTPSPLGHEHIATRHVLCPCLLCSSSS